MSDLQRKDKKRIQELMDASGVRFGTSGARGLVTGMTDEVCYAFTAAFLQTVPATTRCIALGTDLRPSSPLIAAACAAAIRDAGLAVDYCGQLPTPALACHAQLCGVPAIMVTGSHIPFDRNGIKFYGVHGEILKDDEARISQAEVCLPATPLRAELPEVSPQASLGYIRRCLEFFPSGFLAGMRLGFYEHSSVARDLLKDILQGFGAEVISLGRTDAFVPIDTEAVSEADLQRARAWAAEHRFDAIVSTDGDADRPLLGGENGDWLRGDIVGILCARYLGATAVVSTVSCNTALELCGAFAKTVRTRIGSPYVIEAIERLNAAGERNVVGFEPNGGFLVGSSIDRNGRQLSSLLTRDAVLPMLCLLAMAREQGVRVSELPGSLPARYTASDRLQSFSAENSRALLAELRAGIDAGETVFGGLYGRVSGIDQTDGLRIFFANNAIVHLRPSGNAPELRCYAEADSSQKALETVNNTLNYIKNKFVKNSSS